MASAHVDEGVRLREFWNRRYASFSLSESGWLGAGERLNDRIYDCKRQALNRALAALGFARHRAFTVLDAGCGQGRFAEIYHHDYPRATYVGVDISERAVAHLQRAYPAAEFHAADICEWEDERRRTFDVVQSFEVLHLLIDDRAFERAVRSLAARLGEHGVLLVTAPLPDEPAQPADYLLFRSRAAWTEVLEANGLEIVDDRGMYYWLPAGGPSNRYLRYLLTRLGPDVLYAVDRAAFAIGLAPPASLDCRTRLLAIQRT
jgi:SAM-dependent methyltransferase